MNAAAGDLHRRWDAYYQGNETGYGSGWVASSARPCTIGASSNPSWIRIDRTASLTSGAVTGSRRDLFRGMAMTSNTSVSMRRR